MRLKKVVAVLFVLSVCCFGAWQLMIQRAEDTRCQVENLKDFGTSVVIPEAITVINGSDTATELVTGKPERWVGNAALVDVRYRLYLTAAHVAPLGSKLGVVIRRFGTVTATVQPEWINMEADLAVIQASWVPEDSVAFEVAEVPPAKFQVVMVVGYHDILPHGPKASVGGFRLPFLVMRSATDGCITPLTCQSRDEFTADREKGMLLGTDELKFLYPHAVYATHIDRDVVFGVIPGMSGSPVFTDKGVITAVVSRVPHFETSGKLSFFAPAYVARELIERARRDTDAQEARAHH